MSGGFTSETAQQAIDGGLSDLAVFGQPFIAKPDLVDRLRHGWPLVEAGREAYYGGGAHGYIDYPAYSSHDAESA